MIVAILWPLLAIAISVGFIWLGITSDGTHHKYLPRHRQREDAWFWNDPPRKWWE